MANTIKNWQRFIDGIQDFDSEGSESGYYFGRSLDVRSDPRSFTILPRTVKESGTTVTGLIKWGEVYNPTLDVYFYDENGVIYKRTSARSYSVIRTAANSHGNGMVYNPEDDYLHYTTDKTLGRYGPLSGTPIASDDFLGAAGGVPLNTASLDLESSSSRYATAADHASLSITGDLTIEGYYKMESLPAAASQMVLASKWNGSSDERSYKFDLAAVDAVFGDGSDGALTISGNTTQSLTDSACTGTASTYSLSATNASFATGQKILIHQSRGTNAGQWERNEIASYTAGTITTSDALSNTYTSGAQVIVLPEYTNVTVNNGITWTAKAWNGTVGGLLVFLANGTLTITGTITASEKGFIGATADTGGGDAGEGTAGAIVENQASANGNGGGGGTQGDSSGPHEGAGGGGGGNGTAGGNGNTFDVAGGTGGSVSGSADLTTLTFGGGGGAGGSDYEARGSGGNGGTGGGIIFAYAATIATITGSVVSTGGNGTNANSGTSFSGGGGGGAGGSILFKAQTAALGTNKITAAGGTHGEGTNQSGSTNDGGDGGSGRIHLDYYTSYSGTTTPTLDATQDNNLVTSTTYQLRLSVSATDGTSANSETLAKAISPSPSTATWYRYAVTWDASASTAEFFVDGTSIGTSTGAKTSIYDSTALFAIGASFSDAGSAEKFFDGKVDDVRVFNDIRTDDELYLYKDVEIAGATANLQGYWQVDSSTDDTTANANTLTLVNSPVYDTADVPFSSPTTRQDLDQSLDTSGQTYAVPTAISEGATGRQTFTPAKDPQKSIQILVSDTGDDGDWTVTVHDAQNRLIASQTITHANIVVGDNEFIFDEPWRPLTNFTNDYHFHVTVTSTTGTPLLTTTSSNDLETADFHTYYQFLVEDTKWHPQTRFLNYIVIGNERYIGKLEATLYEPHEWVLPAGWKTRCFGYWQEYLVVGVMRGTNIYDFDYGRVYFISGTSGENRPDFWIDVPEGGINALLGSQGKLYIWAGYQGDLLVYEGGARARKLKRTPLVLDTQYIETYPQAVSMWKSLVRYGISNGDSTTVNRCVYTYGSTNERYPDSLTCDYVASTGNYLSTVKIGMTLPLNKELLISYQDGSGYGVDYVSSSNNPFPTARMEMLFEDLQVPYKEKLAVEIVANFEALESGEDVEIEYMNGETDTTWNIDTEGPTTNDIVYRRLVSNGRYNEMRVAIDLTASGANAPKVKSVMLATDNLDTEERYG